MSERAERKEGREEEERDMARESSSVAAMDSVSRSESLMKHWLMRSLRRSWEEGGAIDKVEVEEENAGEDGKGRLGFRKKEEEEEKEKEGRR